MPRKSLPEAARCNGNSLRRLPDANQVLAGASLNFARVPLRVCTSCSCLACKGRCIYTIRVQTHMYMCLYKTQKPHPTHLGLLTCPAPALQNGAAHRTFPAQRVPGKFTQLARGL